MLTGSYEHYMNAVQLQGTGDTYIVPPFTHMLHGLFILTYTLKDKIFKNSKMVLAEPSMVPS